MTADNRRNRVRAMLACRLLNERYGPITPTTLPFPAKFTSDCLRCGTEITVDQDVVQARRYRVDASLPQDTGVIHAECPSPDRQLDILFEVDGDVPMRHLGRAREGTCWGCGRSLLNRRAVQVLGRDGFLHTKHWECRQRTGAAE